MDNNSSNFSIIELPEEIKAELSKILINPIGLKDVDINSLILIDKNNRAYFLQSLESDNPNISISIDQFGVSYNANVQMQCSYCYTVIKSGTRCYIRRINVNSGAIRDMTEKRIYELDGSISRYYPKFNVKSNTCCVYKQKIVSNVVISEEEVFCEGTTVGPYIESCVG